MTEVNKENVEAAYNMLPKLEKNPLFKKALKKMAKIQKRKGLVNEKELRERVEAANSEGNMNFADAAKMGIGIGIGQGMNLEAASMLVASHKFAGWRDKIKDKWLKLKEKRELEKEAKTESEKLKNQNANQNTEAFS